MQYKDREQLRQLRDVKIKESKAKIGADGDDVKRKRIDYLVKAFVYYDGDMELLKADLPPTQLEEMIAFDPWYGKTFEKASALMLEEGILRNLLSLATTQTPQAINAAKTILPALNKRRYNLGVQKQEVANEGLHDFIKSIEKPMSRQQVINVLQVHDPKFIQMAPENTKMLTLEEAVVVASEVGELVSGNHIVEDEDLR